jgi:hypothetical protein
MGAILDHFIKDHGLTMAQAKAALQPWTVSPIEYQGKQVGELMMQNNEVHFALNEDFRKVMGRGKLLRKVLDDLLEEYGFVVTRLFINDRYKPLIERMGFKETHADASYQYFWLDKETRHDCH